MAESNRLTFIGKAECSQHEKDLLHIFGRALWRMGVKVTIVPRGDANSAVIGGVEADGGVVSKIQNQAMEAPRDGLVVYPDTLLMEVLKKRYPNIDDIAVIITNETDLQEYTEALLAAIWKAENIGRSEGSS